MCFSVWCVLRRRDLCDVQGHSSAGAEWQLRTPEEFLGGWRDAAEQSLVHGWWSLAVLSLVTGLGCACFTCADALDLHKGSAKTKNNWDWKGQNQRDEFNLRRKSKSKLNDATYEWCLLIIVESIITISNCVILICSSQWISFWLVRNLTSRLVSTKIEMSRSGSDPLLLAF